MNHQGPNLSTNPSVEIYQHEGNANGFFYYMKWDKSYYDEDGYPINGDLSHFWIVDDYGVLVPQKMFLHAMDSSQFDGDFLSYYGKTIGRKVNNAITSYLMELCQKLKYGLFHHEVVMDFRLNGKLDSYCHVYSRKEIVFKFIWENGQESEISSKDLDKYNIHFLVDY